MATPTPAREEKVFRAYTKEQAEHYAVSRRGYPTALFKIVLDHHTATGGQLGTLVDVGCGPGQATHGLAPYFDRAIGLDPSEGMIAAARALQPTFAAAAAAAREADGTAVPPKATPTPIRFEVARAEELRADKAEPPLVIEDGTVDLLTAATAAHWFDMAGFWPRAARALRPGGTVALWGGTGTMFVHPYATPNAAAVQAAFNESAFGPEMAPYRDGGSEDARLNLYASLPLPWELTPPVSGFDEATFVRREWNKDGAVDGPDDEFFFAGNRRGVTLDQLEMVMTTASTVARWRAAHPDAVGTEDDIVRRLRRRIEALLREAGVEDVDSFRLRGGVAGVLLMVKKKV